MRAVRRWPGGGAFSTAAAAAASSAGSGNPYDQEPDMGGAEAVI